MNRLAICVVLALVLVTLLAIALPAMAAPYDAHGVTSPALMHPHPTPTPHFFHPMCVDPPCVCPDC